MFFFFHRLHSSTLSPTAILFFLFVYLYSLSLPLHLPKGIYSNFAPHSESDTDYFITAVYLAASLGLYGFCRTPADIMRRTAER